tara:strand:- start:13760 stop:15154 length:1395 start_codon:yes stop_codon:yes gene_type:complete
MAEEKSIGTILGELYLEYIKTTNAASMSRVGAPNIAARPIGDEQTALIDFFNSFEPSTPEERQAKAIALEQIRNNNNPFFGLAKDFRDDFKTAAEIKAEEEDIIIEDVVAPDPLIADFVESETRDERIQATEGRRTFKPLSVQEKQSQYIDEKLAEGDFSDEQLNFVQTMLPSDLPYIGLGGTITPTQPDKLPLYVEGMQYGLFNGMSAEELINVQLALVEAEYLYPGSFDAGVLDSRTIAAISKAMEVQNLQGRTNPTLASSASVQLALSGAGPGIAQDIRNFFISEVKKDEPSGQADLAIEESVQLFPEFAAIYGETAAEQILGRKIRQGERAMIGSYYNQALQEASQEVQDMLKAREQARKEAQTTALQTEQIRLQAGLPEGVYSVEAPEQFTAAPGDAGSAQEIQGLITALAGQRFEDKITSIGAYAAELDENDREAEMRSRSRAFTTALNSTGSGALGA